MAIDEHLTEHARGAMIGSPSATRSACRPKACRPNE